MINVEQWADELRGRLAAFVGLTFLKVETVPANMPSALPDGRAVDVQVTFAKPGATGETSLIILRVTADPFDDAKIADVLTGTQSESPA